MLGLCTERKTLDNGLVCWILVTNNLYLTG